MTLSGCIDEYVRHRRSLGRFHTVAGFYRFAMARQYTNQSPMPPRPPKPPAEFIPYIYSENDVRALLDAVDARYEEDWLVRPQTVRTLLLLLYATGLRISEALALTMADVDLADGILTIRETKFYKSRLVPIGTDRMTDRACVTSTSQKSMRSWPRRTARPSNVGVITVCCCSSTHGT